MAKRPEYTDLVDGPLNLETINENFFNIAQKFETLLSRDGATPNTMQGDLDLADADWTNVRSLVVDRMTLVDEDINGILFGDNRTLELQDLTLTNGDIIYYDGVNDILVALEPGAEGQVLKVGADGYPYWGTDIDTDTDTDTDTVGITVQEDGVTVANNVVNIDFVTANGPNAPYVNLTSSGTGPGGGQEIEIEFNNGGEIGNGPLYYNDDNSNITNFVIDGSLANFAFPLDLIALGVPAAAIDAGQIDVDMGMTVQFSGGITGFEHSGSMTNTIARYNASDVKTGEYGLSYPIDNVEFKTLNNTGNTLASGTRFLRFDALVSPNTSSTTPISRYIQIYYNGT